MQFYMHHINFTYLMLLRSYVYKYIVEKCWCLCAQEKTTNEIKNDIIRFNFLEKKIKINYVLIKSLKKPHNIKHKQIQIIRERNARHNRNVCEYTIRKKNLLKI